MLHLAAIPKVSGTKFCYEHPQRSCLTFGSSLAEVPGTSVGLPTRQGNLLECQRQCQRTEGCEWFSYDFRRPNENCALKAGLPDGKI